MHAWPIGLSFHHWWGIMWRLPDEERVGFLQRFIAEREQYKFGLQHATARCHLRCSHVGQREASRLSSSRNARPIQKDIRIAQDDTLVYRADKAPSARPVTE